MIKLGTKTENKPAAIPNINRPRSIAYSFLIRVMVQPTTTKILVRCMHFNFPYVSAGVPANIEPKAEPRAHTDVIRPFQRFT